MQGDCHKKKYRKTNDHLQNTTQKTKDWATRTSLKSRGENSDVTNPVISHEWEKDQIVIMTNGTYQWLFVTQIFCNG